VALFQSHPEGLGLFLHPPALYEIHPCISPLRSQLSCSNEFQTHLSNTYAGRLHGVLFALSDTKIASSSGDMKEQQALTLSRREKCQK
tara:strand:- start:123052 stop:123315 length:264 start_codon:yes stop_codon:yes gene_type:complete